MVSALVSGLSGPGSSPGWGHYGMVCSLARRFTLRVPLSTLMYKWVQEKLMLVVVLRWTRIPSRGVEILLATSCY